MNNPDLQSNPQPTPFERDHQLAPLGDDHEARALRAEAIASITLKELLDLDRGTPAPTMIRMRQVRRVIHAILDPYRDSQVVEQRKAWEDAEAELELQAD